MTQIWVKYHATVASDCGEKPMTIIKTSLKSNDDILSCFTILTFADTLLFTDLEICTQVYKI